jgi:hypothetical protein
MSELTTPSSGRDERGLFKPGNTISKGVGGNPNTKRMAELKQALIACGTVEDVQKLYTALLTAALAGDTPAAKLLLDHLVGRPTQPIEVTGSGPTPIQTDITAIVAIIQQEEPDPDRRLKIARRILSLGQQTVEVASDGPVRANSPTA